MNTNANKYLWFLLLKLNTYEEDNKIILLHQESAGFVDWKPQEMSQLTWSLCMFISM